MLDELDEHATRRARVEEGDQTLGANARRSIDQLDPFAQQAVKRAREVRDLEAEVMQRGAASLRQESRDARFGVGGLEKLDSRVGSRDEDDLHVLIGHVVHRTDRVPEHVAVEGQRIRDPRHDHADVVERPGLGEAAHRLPGS
jgi:hypothetical protein